MGDNFGVRSNNMFDLLQPTKEKNSAEKAPSKSAAARAKKEATKVATQATTPAVPQASPKQAVRTGGKRGGIGNKGTRPGQARVKDSTLDSRGKRTHDRQSELDFQKGHGGARKAGLGFGGTADLQAEAAKATEEFNAGVKDASVAAAAATAGGAAPTTGAAATTTDGKDVEAKKEEKKEEPDLRKTLAEYEADLAAKAVDGDVKQARTAVVGKEFKAGQPPKKNKREKESLFADVKAEAEAKKAAEAAKDAKPAKKAGKKSKTAASSAAATAPKPQKIVLDHFNDTVKPPPRPEAAPRPAALAPKEGDVKPAVGEAPKSGGGRGYRGGGGGGGYRGGRGGRGGGGRGRGGAKLDFTTSFPPLAPASKA